jgi:putative flippase GtrA
MTTQFFRFAVVGVLGAIVNLAIFSLFVKVLDVNHNFASAIAFMFAVTQNFLINKIWTFNVAQSSGFELIFLWAKYVGVNLVGLSVNLLLLNFVIVYRGDGWVFWGQLCGIVGASAFDFFLSKIWVFRGRAHISRD